MHPLLLPELLSIVLSYVEPEDWFNCCRVCRSWHAHFNPKIWETVTIDPFRPVTLSTTINAVERYSHFTKTLIFRGFIQPEFFSVNFPNLQTLKVLCQYMDTLGATGPQDQVGFMWVEVAGFIVRTPSLKRINISSQRNGLPIQVWEAIAFAPNIKALHLDHVKIGISDIQSFWTACQDLEILELDACIVNDRFGPQRLFSKMTDMKLENLMNHSNSLFQVELMSSCPNIKNIYWRGGSFSYFPLDQFSTTIEEGRLKYLDSIDLQGEMISDIQVCRVINAIQQPIKKLGVQMTKIGGLSFAALEPHFNSLQELDLTGCQLPTSKDILMFLRSCKQLISFKAFSIFSSDIEVEEGWPCSRQLSTLYLNIQIDEVDQKEASDRVFRCLSKLVMLKNLNITRYVANLADIPLESKPLQLRLGYGLSQLSTLRRLEMFTFGSHQFMSIEDGIWIRDNLKRLIAVRGVYNPDPRINNQVAELFKKKIEIFNRRRIKVQ